MKLRILFVTCLVVGAASASACGSDNQNGGTAGTSGVSGSSAGGSTTGGSANGATGGTSAAGGAGGIVSDSPFTLTADGQVACGTGACACSDGIDNDGDGLIDGLDPECTGPFDNDESSFATGIPGDNVDPKWQDCFFDGNSGAGDDGCRYSTDCMTGALPPTSPDCTLTQQCIDFCQRLVPNGCDCFGCCQVTDPDGGTVDIFLASTCSMDVISDTTKCPRCTATTTCGNTCGTCELCLGKTLADLPPECTVDGSTAPTCNEGQQVCNATTPCQAGYYCQNGCCLPIPA